MLREYRIPEDSVAGRRRLEEVLEARRRAEEGDDYKPIRRGWFFGEKTLKEELLAQVGAQAGGWHYGEELRESAEAKAERIMAEELKRRKWDAGTLGERRKGDAGKLAIAQRLRAETTVTLSRIANRVEMGTQTHLAHLFCWERRKHETIDCPLFKRALLPVSGISRAVVQVWRHRNKKGRRMRRFVCNALFCALLCVGCDRNGQSQIQVKATSARMRVYADAARDVALDCGPDKMSEASYPLVFYVNPGWSNWNGPYLLGEPKPNDHFGIRFQFTTISNRLTIASAGPDKKFGTQDDIMQSITFERKQ